LTTNEQKILSLKQMLVNRAKNIVVKANVSELLPMYKCRDCGTPLEEDNIYGPTL